MNVSRIELLENDFTLRLWNRKISAAFDQDLIVTKWWQIPKIFEIQKLYEKAPLLDSIPVFTSATLWKLSEARRIKTKTSH